MGEEWGWGWSEGGVGVGEEWGWGWSDPKQTGRNSIDAF